MIRRPLAMLVALLATAFATFAVAQSPDAPFFSAMRWRLVGPNRAGRAWTVAGVPGDPAVYYLGTPDPATPDGKAKIDAAIEICSRYPNCLGYFLTDEPGTAAFPLLGRVVAYLREHDPKRLAFINLLPTYANEQQLGAKTYREHVERYIAEVKPEVVCYDNYPCVGPDDWRGDYYLNMELVREISAKAGLPFWNFALSTGHYGYRVPTKADLALQAFSDLAYGARGVFYFTYGHVNAEGFGQAIMDAEGRPTPTYELVRRLNPVVRAWGLWLAESLAVCHVGEVPEGARPLEAGDPDQAVVACEPGNCIIATMRAKSGALAVMVVNKDRHHEQAFRLRFREGIEKAAEVKAPGAVAEAKGPKAEVAAAQDVSEGMTVRVAAGFAKLYEVSGRGR